MGNVCYAVGVLSLGLLQFDIPSFVLPAPAVCLDDTLSYVPIDQRMCSSCNVLCAMDYAMLHPAHTSYVICNPNPKPNV